MPTSTPNLNILAPFVLEILRGSQNKNWELLISPRRLLANEFLHRTLVLVKAYNHTKFQLPSSISFGDMEGVPKMWAADLPRCPLADSFYAER